MVRAKILATLLVFVATTRSANGEPDLSYKFPTTDYPVRSGNDGGMVHGLCVLGASEASATISPDDSGFAYTPIPGFKDGVSAFGVKGGWPMTGVDGNGPQVCEGGIYLRPSSVHGPPPGVDVTLEATGIDEEDGATICVFVERLFGAHGHSYNRQGNWKQPLIDDGFKPSDVRFSYSRYNPDRLTSYCKTFAPPPPPPQFPSDGYKFPKTHYPPMHTPRHADGGMVHALCVMGAADVTTTIVGNNVYNFRYIQHENLRNGMKVFSNAAYRFSDIDGGGDPVCEGGLYLQPSGMYGPNPGLDVTVDVTPLDDDSDITLCLFVEEPFTNAGGYHRNRLGNWKEYVIKDGFEPAENTIVYGTTDDRAFTSYCKTFAPPTPPPQFPSDGYKFPKTHYPPMHTPRHADGGMVHALCVMGAADVTTTIVGNNVYNFRYIQREKLRNGMKVFSNAGYKFSDIDGGGDPVCEGGLYLQPSGMYGPNPGLDVTVDVTPLDDDSDITLCLFVEEPFTNAGGYHRNRLGNWKEYVIKDGFEPAENTIVYGTTDDRAFTSYCKKFSPPTTKTSPPTGKELSLPSCRGDVKLLQTYGATEFPMKHPIDIISQDKTTVTVALNQAWDNVVDKYFYQYYESSFSSKCYEEEAVENGQLIDTITIQCLSLTPTAMLNICLQDTSGSLLSVEDDGVVSNCCGSDAPKGTPTVCYKVEVMCETSCGTEESSVATRNLRARIF